MHNEGPKEQSNIFLFLPIVLIGVYAIYLSVVVPFRIGAEKGTAEAPYVVKKEEKSAEEEESFDLRELRKPNETLIALGGRVYANNCASCHGAEGLGNGAAGQKLAVKPRNFHTAEGWKNGASAIQMYRTLEKGLGSMPNFPALNPKQKFAVSHYIHAEFMKTWPEDSAADIASLPTGSGAATSTKIDPYKTKRIPVVLAMENLATTVVRPAAHTHDDHAATGLGARIYQQSCATCHGPHGEGKTLRNATPAQLKGLASGSLLQENAPWREDYDAFKSILVHGIPGLKPSFGQLSDAEMQELHGYVRSLR